MQGVPGDRRRLAPTKTFLLSCEIDLGRQVDVPAACDIFYNTSRASFMSFYRRCTLVGLDVLLTVRLKVSGSRCSLASDFLSLQTTRQPEPLEDPPAYFPVDVSAEF